LEERVGGRGAYRMQEVKKRRVDCSEKGAGVTVQDSEKV
jgi:hypothetical protein